MLTSSEIQPGLLKQPLKAQKKLKDLEFIPVFSDILKLLIKNADVSRTQVVCHVIWVFLGSAFNFIKRHL